MRFLEFTGSLQLYAKPAESRSETGEIVEIIAPEFTSEAYILTYNKYLMSDNQVIIEPNLVAKYKSTNQQDNELKVKILEADGIPFKILPTDEVYAIDDADSRYSNARGMADNKDVC